MKILKINCSSLRCPYCGSAKYNIKKGEIFECTYCGQKFSFDLEEIDFSSENKVFIEELKSEFNEKALELYDVKKTYQNSLIKYKKLANRNKLYYFSIIFFIVSFITFLSSIINYDSYVREIVYYLLGSVGVSGAMLLFSKIRRKKAREKYSPIVSFYAEKVVSCQYEIDVYTMLISKLSK